MSRYRGIVAPYQRKEKTPQENTIIRIHTSGSHDSIRHNSSQCQCKSNSNEHSGFVNRSKTLIPIIYK